MNIFFRFDFYYRHNNAINQLVEANTNVKISILNKCIYEAIT